MVGECRCVFLMFLRQGDPCWIHSGVRPRGLRALEALRMRDAAAAVIQLTSNGRSRLLESEAVAMHDFALER